VIEKSIAGPLGSCVKFSTLQEYGVDRVFFLENDNVDSSQRNIVFLARGEKSSVVLNIAGMSLSNYFCLDICFHYSALLAIHTISHIIGTKSRLCRAFLLYLVSLGP